MGWQQNPEYTYMVGIGGILLTVIGWISLRRGPGITQRNMETNAKICYIIGTLKICAGIFVLTSMAAGQLWGFMLILFGVLWVVRGNRWKRVSLVLRARNQLRRNGVAIVGDNENENNNNNNNNNGNNGNGPGYRRIPEIVDGPEGPSNDPIIVQIQQHQQQQHNQHIQASSGGAALPSNANNREYSGSHSSLSYAAAAASGTNTSIIPQSQFGVVSPIPSIISNNENSNGAVPPAAFPGPSYVVATAGGTGGAIHSSTADTGVVSVAAGAVSSVGTNVTSNDSNNNNSNSNEENNTNKKKHSQSDQIDTNYTELNEQSVDSNVNVSSNAKKSSILKKHGIGKNNDSSKNSELTVPLNAEVDETAPIPYSIPPSHLIDSNDGKNNEGEAAYS